jgi:hypothetical protein
MLMMLSSMVRRGAVWLSALFLSAFLATSARTQEQGHGSVPEGPVPKITTTPHTGKLNHRFWDKENIWLFAGIGATRTLDYFSTLNMRRRGRQEIFLTNDLVDNHAAFAMVEAAAVGASIGASYLFHRYGHHKLERWTSFVHISLAFSGSVRNYCLETAHPSASLASMP